ncbi:hypothetical protein [Bradyrhizobium viridifuturi]|uniref:hypothetical protein n=1 Tax=Bradyrhizobium viridifuturi TaxID=1654716 RepID=UPI00067EB9EE|nr:hypothetical protein [Bradyrhizobium viridifuturi]
MTDHASSNEQLGTALTFERGRSATAWILSAALIAIPTIAASVGSTEAKGSVIVCLLLACMFISIGYYKSITEFDLRTRRFKVSRRFVARRSKTIADCPLDQCRALGRIEYGTDDHPSYGVYVELADGTRHEVPLKKPTIQEAGRVASLLSEATGIPRLDTKF